MEEANVKLITEGFNMLGLKEIPGYRKNNPAIVRMLQQQLPWVTRDEVNWCGASMQELCVRVGARIHGDKLYGARNWRHEGRLVKDPKPGDIAVMWRVHPTKSWKGHVTLFLKNTDGYIYGMGGNQLDEWNVSKLRDRVLFYRRLYLEPPAT